MTWKLSGATHLTDGASFLTRSCTSEILLRIPSSSVTATNVRIKPFGFPWREGPSRIIVISSNARYLASSKKQISHCVRNDDVPGHLLILV